MRDFLSGFFKSTLLMGCLLGSLLCVQQAMADDPTWPATFCTNATNNGCAVPHGCPMIYPPSAPICLPTSTPQGAFLNCVCS